jgi:hypothetical protein
MLKNGQVGPFRRGANHMILGLEVGGRPALHVSPIPHTWRKFFDSTRSIIGAIGWWHRESTIIDASNKMQPGTNIVEY